MESRIVPFLTSRVTVRRIVTATFAIYILLGIAFATHTIEFPHRFEWFLALLAFGSAVALFTPQLLVRAVPKINQEITELELGKIELFLTIAIALSWIGTLFLYTANIGYDSFVHFSGSLLVPLAFATPVTLFYTRNSPFKFFITLVAIALLFGVGVEIFEWSGDVTLGTTMSGESGQPLDTLRDFIYDTLGAIIGAGIAVSTHFRNKEKK